MSKQFEDLTDDQKVKLMMPRMSLMVSMLKDIKLNMDNFWIKNGTMTKDSMVYTDFNKKYEALFKEK